MAGVSRSGYYNWESNASKREADELKDRADFDLILEAYRYKGINKGVRGIHMHLLHQKPAVIMNTKKIHRLMRKYGLYCPIRKPKLHRATTNGFQKTATAQNILNRRFDEYGPREAFTTDITYIFYDGGRKQCYLSVIRDVCTHEVMAHITSWSMTEDFVLETVNQFLINHKSEMKKGALLHSDQGIHYKCIDYRKLLKNKKLRQSMSRKANCWDNAPQESFFGHMKDEIKDKILICRTITEVKKVINDYMDYYNNERGQWKLAKLTPKEYYEYRTTHKYPNYSYGRYKTMG